MKPSFVFAARFAYHHRSRNDQGPFAVIRQEEFHTCPACRSRTRHHVTRQRVLAPVMWCQGCFHMWHKSAPEVLDSPSGTLYIGASRCDGTANGQTPMRALMAG